MMRIKELAAASPDAKVMFIITDEDVKELTGIRNLTRDELMHIRDFLGDWLEGWVEGVEKAVESLSRREP